MNTKKNHYFRGMFVIFLIGISVIASAEVDNPTVFQDSAAYHQFMVEQANAKVSSRNSSSGSFQVGGNVNTFYPVQFDDGGWIYDEATILNIGRANTHYDGMWRGSVIATFRYHVNHWGHGSEFIDADIKSSFTPFIAGWADPTAHNDLTKIIIWLRGASTYFYHSNYPVNPVVTNGPLLLLGQSYPVKTQVDSYVNSHGATLDHNLWVRGGIRANEVKVQVNVGADFVFEDDYELLPLEELEQFVTTNKHLPDIAPANEMVENGMDMSEMQIKLLQKIEELTLYIIEQNRELQRLKAEIETMKNYKP
ncbi:MAG: hypothetical protein FWG79_00705 [Bacteroidales bacterium]|nr:hypothetical protein [Bacteroidales bacterium]